MAWSAGVSDDKIGRMLLTAIKKGSSQDGNRSVKFVGCANLVESFYGKFIEGTGIIECTYYSSAIFAVDLDKHRVTNFSMYNYSPSTGQNISAWEHAIFNAFNLHGNLGSSQYRPWVVNYGMRKYHDHRYPQTTRDNTLFDKFRENVPWAKKEHDTWWFYWDLYDAGIAQAWYNTIVWLSSNQNWRYFTHSWVKGAWTHHFIDADAERRYNTRQKRKAA